MRGSERDPRLLVLAIVRLQSVYHVTYVTITAFISQGCIAFLITLESAFKQN